MALFFKIGMLIDKIGIEFFSLIRVVEGTMVANCDHKDFMPLVMGYNCKGGTFVSLSQGLSIQWMPFMTDMLYLEKFL